MSEIASSPLSVAVPGAPLIVAASPRRGGNSDRAAELFARGVAEAGGSPVVVHVRELDVRPCLGCERCHPADRGVCVRRDRGKVEEFYALLMAAPYVAVASPVYFYHVPSQFKALIDRSQPWYERWQAGDPAQRGLPRRPAYPLLVAGRPTGEKLFDGILVTLKYWLVNFGLVPEAALCVRGVDGPHDFDPNTEIAMAMVAQGREAELAARAGA